LNELDENEITLLQTISDANTGRTSGMAQSILCFFYDICRENENMNGEPPVVPPSFRKEDENQYEEDLKYKDYNLGIYPNPAQTEVFISVNNSNVKINRVELFDLVGRQLQTQVFEKSHGTFPIDEFTNGIYILKVHLSNGETVNRKLIKQN